MFVTVQPLATSVAFADSPVADGVALVPVIVTVLLLYAVVPPVPSNAANRINMLSTLATNKAQLLKITLPSTLFNVLPIVKVFNAAVPLTSEMLVADKSVSIAGKLTEVSAPQADMVTLVASTKEGAEILAREAKVAKLKIPAQ